MPIGNQQIWDKGIGEPATNMLMQSTQQSGPSGFNPMALSNQNNAGQISEPAVETPAPVTPAQPARPAQPAMGGGQQQHQGPNPKVTAAKNALDQAMLQFQQAQQVLGGNSNVYAKHAGMTLANWQRKLFEAQQRYQQALQMYGG